MKTIFFSFADVDNAKRFVGAVLDHGARSEDISVVSQTQDSWDDVDLDKDGNAVEPGSEVEETAAKGLTTTTAGDAALGATAGAGVGLGAGAIAALASMFIPGVGLVMGGGALAAALLGTAGAAGAGAVAGGALGYLKDMGVDSEVAEQFQEDYNANHVLVGVMPGVDTISENDVWTLADKYQAVHTSQPYPSNFTRTSVYNDPVV